MLDQYFNRDQDQERNAKLRRFGRALGGYALGGIGLGLGVTGATAASPIGFVAGLGLGAGAMYASREVLRPIYQDEEARETAQEESRLRRLGRGLMYTGGMGLKLISASMVVNAVFPGADAGLSAGERLIAGGVGAALFFPGDKLMEASYDPNLFERQQAQSPEPETSAA